MAAEAHKAEAEADESQPISQLLQRETCLSAFLGTVQSSIHRAQTMKNWMHAEVQLEKVLPLQLCCSSTFCFSAWLQM